MNCPRCSDKTDKVRLDIYGCLKCGHTWLIHALAETHPSDVWIMTIRPEEG